MKNIFHASLVLATLSFATLTTNRAKADTYVFANSQGAMAYEFLTGWTFGTMYPDLISALNTGAGSPHSMPSFLKFDLSGATISGTDVASATLRLYLVDVAASGFGGNPSDDYPVAVNFSLVTGGDWNKSTITYGNAPAAGSSIGLVSGIDSIGSWLELDITSLFQGWLDGDINNYGLKLSQPESLRDGANTPIFALFASDGYEDQNLRPQIIVQTVPEPSTYFLIGVGLGTLFILGRIRKSHA